MTNDLMETGEVELYSVEFEPSVITINGHDDLKETIQSYADKYKGLVFGEDGLNDAKKVRAEMNNVAKSLDDKRKSIKKEYNAPLKEFENEFKKLIQSIQEVIDPIDQGIKHLEEQERLSKQKELEERVNNQLEEASEYVKNRFEYDKRWTNKSYSMKKVAEEVETQIKSLEQEETQIKINQDIIANYCEAVKVEAGGWLNLLNTGHTAPEIMKMIDKSIADEKARKQAEIEREQARKEQEQYDAEQRRIKEESYVDLSVEQINEPVNEEPELDFDVSELLEAERYPVELRITGTAEQLNKLNTFIVDSGMSVERL